MQTWKDNIEETKRRYIDWWSHKGVILNMWEHLQTGVVPHADIKAPAKAASLDQKWFDPEWRSQYLDWYVAHSSLKADILPVANTQLGPGSLAAILGGVFEGGEDTIWIHPDPHFKDDITFDETNPNWLLHKNLLKACKRRAQGHYYVGMPDLMEGLDVLAALKGTDTVLLDLATQPSVVERQMQQINDIYFKVFDELYDIIREGDEMAFCYFSSWAPGKMTKLQSDISTMISEEDYRRFVQPFIREQCRKIPYTLYHLDGVGAVRHLPALLEIEELKAIQWTPGVGQPQGGSPKWYDLYRRILEGGKSVMACWVTLDELAPLLNAIGTDGVHLEMDFHNEQEINKAIDIMNQFTPKMPLSSCCREAGNAESLMSPFRPDLEKCMKERILVLDGGQGTTIQQYRLTEDQFRGSLYSGCSFQLKGCNDLLNLTNPGINADVIRRFIEAGADIITTHTFNSQRISLQGFHVENRVREINLAACSVARSMAQLYSTPEKPIFVAGGVGPTSKCVTLGAITKKELFDAYYEQIQALVDGGVDCLLIETIFDTENALTALDAFKKTGSKIPVIMSFTIKDPKGFNMLGQDLLQFMLSLKDEPVMCVGLNCSLGAEMMLPFLRRIAANVPQYVIAFPNAGLPNKDGKYDQTPKMMQKAVWPLIEDHVVNIIGGCCGTDDGHIREIAKLVQADENIFVTPHQRGVAPLKVEEVAEAPEKTAEKPAEKLVVKSHVEASEAAEKTVEKVAAKSEPAAPAGDDALYNAVLKGKLPEAVAATKASLEKGIAPQDIINGDMIRAMSQIGQDFQDGKAYVPQLLMAARAMKGAMEVLKPLMVGQKVETLGKVVIGTVKGDLHDIGKNLVASMLEGCGFEVVNIGVDVSKEKFIAALQENKANILCMSALLTTTMPQMKEVVEAVQAAGIRSQVKIMVGGAPLSQEYADEIGADGYSDNANSAVALAKRLMGK